MTSFALQYLGVALLATWAGIGLFCVVRSAWFSESGKRLVAAFLGLNRFARATLVVIFVAAASYAYKKPDSGDGLDSLHPTRTILISPLSLTGSGSSTNDHSADDSFRWTSFTNTGSRFDFSVAWSPSNRADMTAIDVFYKERLDNPQWRWVYRHDWFDADAGQTAFSVYYDDLPYCEDVVTRRFRVSTNSVTAPFGAVYTNIHARVLASNATWRSGFFLAGNQHDSDHDGLPDAVERSLELDPFDPDMDGDGLPDGAEVALGSNPVQIESDGDGIPDNVEVGWAAVSTNGITHWLAPTDEADRTILTFSSSSGNGVVSRALPFPISILQSHMTNLTVNANGLVSFSSDAPGVGSGYYGNYGADSIPFYGTAGATVAAFWDDLYPHPALDSSVSLFVVGDEGARTGVVEFARMGFYSAQNSTNDWISCQVQFFEAETNLARVVYGGCSGLGDGQSATFRHAGAPPQPRRRHRNRLQRFRGVSGSGNHLPHRTWHRSRQSRHRRRWAHGRFRVLARHRPDQRRHRRRRTLRRSRTRARDRSFRPGHGRRQPSGQLGSYKRNRSFGPVRRIVRCRRRWPRFLAGSSALRHPPDARGHGRRRTFRRGRGFARDIPARRGHRWRRAVRCR